MAFKNAFKNLIAHFGIVWSLLLYILICSAGIVGLSLPFILPIANAFADAGVFDGIRSAFSALFNDGGWNGLWDGLYNVYLSVVNVFKSNDRVASLTMLFLIFIVIVAFRFFFGLYEIPLATVLDGRMSCNAHYGLGGKFFSMLSVSVRYSLAKMPITIAFDAAMWGVVYGVTVGIGMSVALPFVVILVIVAFLSFKKSMLACWAPCVADGTGVIRGFARSVEICFKRFGSIFSTYLVTIRVRLVYNGVYARRGSDYSNTVLGCVLRLPRRDRVLQQNGQTILYRQRGIHSAVGKHAVIISRGIT